MKLMMWFAPGALFYEGEGNGTVPQSLECVLASRPLSDPDSGQIVGLSALRFELRTLSPAGDVAHYELVTKPPTGIRWILARPGRICAERIPSV